MQNNNKQQKDRVKWVTGRRRYLVGCTTVAFLILLICIVRTLGEFGMMPLKILVPYVLKKLLVLCIGTVALGSCLGLVLKFWNALDSDTVSTKLDLFALRVSHVWRAKNVETIRPYLQGFLYRVIQLNNQFLKLPLGPDASCLSPRGPQEIFEQDCIFYEFQLIMPEAPTVSTEELRDLFQQYIELELDAYGIAGLRSHYQDALFQKYPSVFVDRVLVDEINHLLTVEVLYICSESSAEYMKKAKQRRRSSGPVEPETFDDELR